MHRRTIPRNVVCDAISHVRLLVLAKDENKDFIYIIYILTAKQSILKRYLYTYIYTVM